MSISNENLVAFPSVGFDIVKNRRLREPQREAYQAVDEHFQRTNDPALIQIPVGGGKTGLISILPFGIAQGRVLIVAPNVTIRDAIFAAVDSANPKCFWHSTGVCRTSPVGPFAAILDGPTANFADCIESHYVVTNVQQIGQASNRWLAKMPNDFFDMIILDEGHHNAANSWQRLMKHFPNAKIISLTATPFRSDGQEVIGTSIYRYSFLRAMSRGYIKTLQSIQVSPCELSFVFEDTAETATLEKVMELREETWFSRGVALADECNRHIVRKSIQACERLRSEGSPKHQVIAVACSVEHAERISRLYHEAGYRACEIHSKQTKVRQSQILKDLRAGKLDAIVQVQMLGEGFDHPALSVAAVFRPFRSLSPYIQFVGRVMRVLKQRSPADPDNRGIIVSHVGLNTERHWEQFRQLDDEDQALWAGIVSGGSAPEKSDSTTDDEDMADDDKVSFFQPQMLVEWERIGGVTESAYGDVILDAELDLPQVKSEFKPSGSVVGPQERRRQAKSRLNHEVDQAVRTTLSNTRLNSMGGQISRVHPMLRNQKNWSAARYWIYYTLNQRLGRRPKSGREWDLEEVERAADMLPKLVAELTEQINQRSMRSTNSWRPY